jgi:hypothetical protein
MPDRNAGEPRREPLHSGLDRNIEYIGLPACRP